MKEYCSACGYQVEVMVKPILGRMKEIVCAKYFHFIRMVPER